MEFMFDWEDGDRFSFEDSDRFEEDSLCSWLSETESICNNWRGWKKGATGGSPTTSQAAATAPVETCDEVLPLVELAARTVAFHIPFEVVENVYPPVPENLQLRISFWSFPENEDDIRLYSCLANGSPEEFQKGELLLKSKVVKDVLQIGFHLSGTIGPSPSLSIKDTFNVAITFYKRRVTTCSCTCTLTGKWCSHVVALCLYRIVNAEIVCLRAPVSESLSRLHRDQLQKFAQYLISELPQQILPTAQRLLDELLSSQANTINTVRGAPDPTAGPPATEPSQWFLDDSLLHENIKKTLVRFCGPGPLVFSDVNSLYLSNPAPAASAEWTNLLRPLRGREPEGVWNLLSIIRELFRRRDSNAIFLLKILTEECISCEQVVVWWFSIRTSAIHSHHGNHGHRAHNNNSSSMQNQHSCASMCDEIVTLWRYAALNPMNSPAQRKQLDAEFRKWHMQVIESSKKGRRVGGGGANVRKVDMEVFAGFKPAMEACLQDWNDFPIEGVTYSERKSEDEASCSWADEPISITSSNCFSMSQSDSTHSNVTKHVNRQKSDECDSDFIAIDSSDSRGDDNENILQPPSHELEGDDESESANEEQGARRKNKKHSDKSSLEKSLSNQVKSDADSDGSNEMPDANQACAAEAIPEGAAAEAPPGQVKEPDELNMYFYDTKSKVQDSPKKKKDEVYNPFGNVKKLEDKMQIQFNRTEALYVHGHTWYACHLAIQLAEEMIANPPKLDTEVPTGLSNKGRKRYLHQQSTLASQLLFKISFICSVLAEQPGCHNLAFQIGLMGLQITRQPASTKGLEVKLANQESELVVLLKRVPLGTQEMDQLRKLAEQMRNWSVQKPTEGVLPLMLAGYIFEAMCLTSTASSPARSPSKSIMTTEHRKEDEILGFEAAVSALAMKNNVSEAAHPLLCEGTRRQRGDLALSMFMQYRDDQTPLRRILNAFLDKQHLNPTQKVVQCIPSSIAPNKPSFLSMTSKQACSETSRREQQHHRSNTASSQDSKTTNHHEQKKGSHASGSKSRSTKQGLCESVRGRACDLECADEGRGASPRGSPEDEHVQGMLPQQTDRRSVPMATGWEEEAAGAHGGVPYQSSGNQNKWDRILGRHTKRSREMASIDSSAPETTSSDNSPALGRRLPPPGGWGRHQGPGSDSGSSGNSSDSLSSTSSWDKPANPAANEARDQVDGAIGAVAALRVGPCVASEMNESRSSTPSPRNGRYRGKNRTFCPSIPNQPSEASAHFYLELAKTIVTKAGGNSSPTHFTQNPANNNQSGPHRGLLLAAFEVGFYALSLYNAVSPNWLSRTYSAYESFIRSQALELGSGGINILVNYWEGHLTPAEAAAIADRASRCRDLQMVQAAAELALSCLSHAHALNPSDVNRALLQCKEQDMNMLSKACLAVENAAKGGDVYPDVLFTVGKHWEWLHNQTQHHREDEAGNLPPEDNNMAVPGIPAQGMHPPVPYNEPVIPLQVPLYHTYPVHYGPRPNHPSHPAYHPARPGFIPHNQPTTSQAMPTWGGPAYPPCSGPYVAVAGGFPPRGIVGPNIHPYIGGAPVPAVLPASGRGARGGSPALVPAAVVPHQSQFYLHHTYRVGMLAMDTLARRVHDERYQSRFSRNPTYGDDVKWLLSIAKKLGASHVQQYCFSVPNIIFSPYVLQEIVTEAAQFLSNVHHQPLQNTLRTPTLTHIIQKCQQMYMQCIHQRMNHISQHEYEEILGIMRNAQSAFLLSPCGANQFQDFLNNLHRMKPGKRELLTRIISSLSFGNIYEHSLSNR